MHDDPFPQTLPQQLRELGSRWRVERLKQLYTTPIGWWMLCWLGFVLVLAIANQIAAADSGYLFRTASDSWTWSATLGLQHVYSYATQTGAVALLLWFQCRWPSRPQWVLFAVLAIAYAVLMQGLASLPPYSEYTGRNRLLAISCGGLRYLCCTWSVC